MLKTTEVLPDLSGTGLALYTIRSMKLFLFEPLVAEDFTPEHAAGSYSGLLKITSRNRSGWAAFSVPCGVKPFDLVQWATVFYPLKGLSVEAAYRYIQMHLADCDPIRAELAAAALSELADNIEFPSAVPVGLLMDEDRLLTLALSYFSF